VRPIGTRPSVRSELRATGYAAARRAGDPAGGTGHAGRRLSGEDDPYRDARSEVKLCFLLGGGHSPEQALDYHNFNTKFSSGGPIELVEV
jgi:hypothetical protein